MAYWQILKEGAPLDAQAFDDGNQAGPGDDGFSIDAVKAQMQKEGGDGFNYMGASPPPAEPVEDEKEQPST